MLVKSLVATVGALALGFFSSAAMAAGPQIVAGPGVEPACFAPWGKDVKYFQWPKKEGPYRIAVVNGFVANVWRIQMIKTAKAYAAVPEIAKDLKEFKVVSVGTDMAAQLGAVEDYINQGFDAVLIDPNTPTGWDRVVRLANQKGTVLIAFDNQVDTKDMAGVGQDQTAMGVLGGEWLVKNVGKKGRILEIRGVPGFSADKERHDGVRSVLSAPGNDFEIVEVVGNWAPATRRRPPPTRSPRTATSTASSPRAVRTAPCRRLSTPSIRSCRWPARARTCSASRSPIYAKDGLKGLSYGQSPAQVAIALKEAIAALKGGAIPQMVSIPNPVVDYTNMKAGEDYFPDLKADFFAANAFPPCGLAFTAPQLMSQSEENVK